MKITFRVDASCIIGSGHVMRCLSLAEEFKRIGHEIVFVMRIQPGDLCEYTKSRGFKVEALSMPLTNTFPKNSSDYQSWLLVPEAEDAKDFLSVASDADLICIDHYGINTGWETFVKSRIKCKILIIDDLVRKHNCDIIIDQTLERTESEYHKTSNVTQVLSGTKYALLKNQFSYLHQLARLKKIDRKSHRLLLTMGGVDNPNATLKVLGELSKRNNLIQTTVLLSDKASNFESVRSFCESHGDWVTHIPFCEDMAELMLKHTISIGAPGSTSWERACMGLPSILVPLAANQLEISHNLVKNKAALSITFNEIENQLNNKLDELQENFVSMRLNALNLCDGKGCSRVVDEILKLGWF